MIDRKQTKLGRMYTDGVKSFFSVTTILSKHYPKGHFFDTWLKNYGYFADLYTRAKAQMGTLVHMILHQMKTDPSFNQIERYYVADVLHEFMDPTSISIYRGKTVVVDNVMKYIESYQTWLQDYDVSYYGSEVMLFHQSCDWAGATDDPIKINDKNMISDIKTGKPFDTHLIQGIAYAILWNRMYPDHKMKHIGVLYIKDDYVIKPTYKFETVDLQSSKGQHLIKEWQMVMAQFRHKYAKADGTYPTKGFYQPKDKLNLNIKREFINNIIME